MKNVSNKHLSSVVVAAVALLLPVSGFAQTTIGSWQTSSDDGWIDWGNQLSITNAANSGKYAFPAGVVSGFTQSLEIKQGGFQQNLAIKLQNNGYVNDFLLNHRLTFTFSVPPDTGAAAGYSQIAELAINAEGYGFQAQPFDGSKGDWSATGDTGDNQGAQPNFYFFTNAPARSQTVTLDYTDVLNDPTFPASPGWLELIFTFNNGGGAPTNWYVNEVVLSSDPTLPLLVNAFDDTNEISPNGGAPWVRWFGLATDVPETEWDPSDANGDTNSGSMKINSFFPDSFFFSDNTGPQFVVYNDAYFDVLYGSNGLPGYGNATTTYVATNISFDLRFDPISQYYTNTGNWPTIEVGPRTDDYGDQFTFGTATISQTNTNWVHFDIPIGPNPAWANIHALFFKHWTDTSSPDTLNGEVDLYVDNIEISMGEVDAAPTLAIEEANPALRMFAGPGQYQRTQVASVDENQSWVGGSFPVTYSFTLSDYDIDPSLNELHVFLIPLDHVTSGAAIDQYTDYSTASNSIRLNVTGPEWGAEPVAVELAWKTNLVNSNPNNIVANFTNATATGTWTLTFNSDTAGTVTAPGASPVAFSIPAAVAATFANPLVAIFGVQPNDPALIGQQVDFTQIQTVNVASPGVPINSDFTTGAAIDTNVWRTASVSQDASNLVVVGSGTPWWVYWTFPDTGFELATKAELANGAVAWKTPDYFTGYDTNNAVMKKYLGTRVSALIPEAGLPTLDGTSNGVPGNAAFFRLENPPPAE